MLNLMKGRTYIIHIYRGEEDNPESLIGTIEDVEKGVKERFNGMGGLWEKINGAQRNKKRKQSGMTADFRAQ